jgi:acyl carrier protein
MSEPQIISQLEPLFSQVLQQPVPVFTASTTAADVAGWNSLSYLLLITAIEEEFKLKFSFRDVQGFTCIGDMALCIQQRLNLTV